MCNSPIDRKMQADLSDYKNGAGFYTSVWYKGNWGQVLKSVIAWAGRLGGKQSSKFKIDSAELLALLLLPKKKKRKK